MSWEHLPEEVRRRLAQLLLTGDVLIETEMCMRCRTYKPIGSECGCPPILLGPAPGERKLLTAQRVPPDDHLGAVRD